MAIFEAGKPYESNDSGYDSITVLDELNAMRGYLAGDCGCCENSGNCDFLANLSFPEKSTDCLWRFSQSLIREEAKRRESK